MLAPLLISSFGPVAPPEPVPVEPTGIEQNFVQDYRQTGYRVGNVLYLRSPEQMRSDRRKALQEAARKAVLRKLVQRAVEVIGRDRIEAALNELRMAA